jgi:NAD-dependent dihydropyrimidine dehydrogenase PreA subunit
MKKTRKIIEIDENKCNGCGLCILSCAEGALKLIDGKARLVGDILCDGIGACIGQCPEGALTIIEREADAFDEDAVEHHLRTEQPHDAVMPGSATLACGCPSSSIMTLTPKKLSNGQKETSCAEMNSQLGHWPVKLQLLSPAAPFLKGSDMLLMADCCGVASPTLHNKLLKDRTVAIACPKLDDVEKHIVRLAEILAQATPKTLAVVHMEVPCCTGLVHAAIEALRRSGVNIPMKHIVISRGGEILAEEAIPIPEHGQVHI